MLLNLIFFILFFCLLLIVFLPNSSIFYIRQIGLICSSLVFLLSLLLIDSFCLNLYYFQNIITYQIGFDFLNLYFTVGLDGVSLFFFLLSSFLIFLCVLFVWDEHLIK